MKFSDKSINNTKNFIESNETKNNFRLNNKFFTRNRKIDFKNLVYYNLNKKGLTSKMEIIEFEEIVNMTDISSVAILKQREKLNADIYNAIRNKNLETFYNDYKNEVKLFNGYILVAVDGSDFEIPNTLANRINYNSTKNNTSVPRALVSNYFDVLNHYILSTVFDKETASEKDLDSLNFNEIKNLNIPFPIIRIKDRGYVSLKDFYYSNLNDDKFVVRLKKQDYKQEISLMENNDEIVEIKYDHRRMYPYKKIDLEFYNEICKDKKSIYIRVIKIELPSGEIEYVATNLKKEEISTEQMKELYNLRWQIELNYHLLKESLKIETITSSKPELIKQDIFSQMLAFNLLQSFINDAQDEFDKSNFKYKHKMKINKNMAVGFFKKSLIVILIENDIKKQQEMLDAMSNKIKKYLVPVRKNRKYSRDKNKHNNKYSINKRKSF